MLKIETFQSLDNGKIQGATEFLPVLEAIGLDSLAGVKAYDGDLVKNHNGRRDIYRIATKDRQGRSVLLFLKRNWRAYKKDGIKSFLRHGKVWSISRREWEYSLALKRAGRRVSDLVAYGEDCAPLWEKFSFLITKSAPGLPLEDYLKEYRDRGRRRQVFDLLAAEVRQMHDAGLATPDLFARHLFVELAGDRVEFCLIDMARVDRGKVSLTRRARDLAALNASAPVRFVSAKERLRFLRVYAGKRDKRLAQLIRRRMTHLLKRSKFARFAER